MITMTTTQLWTLTPNQRQVDDAAAERRLNEFTFLSTYQKNKRRKVGNNFFAIRSELV